jgi:hypothetical protein
MNRPIRKALIAGTVAVGMSAGLTGTAFAAATPTTTVPHAGAKARVHLSDSQKLQQLKAKANVAINARLSSLHFAIGEVSNNSVITPADKTTLLGILNHDVSGLTALGPKIQADTTLAQGRTDYRTIFSGYRVYALALPQVLFATAADDITVTALPRLQDANTRLTALLSGKDKAKDTPTVQALMRDLAAQISVATGETNGLSNQVLSFTPAQWDANHKILAGPLQTLKAARGHVHTARRDVASVIEEIKK